MAIKETTPTHTLGMPLYMIACTHHAAFHVWTLGLTKAFATLRLIMITIYKLQAKRKPQLE